MRRTASLAIAILALLPTIPAPAAFDLVALPGQIPAFANEGVDTGPADPNEMVDLVFALRLREREALASTEDVLSHEELVARHGVDPRAVEAWLRDEGLEPTRIGDDGTLVRVSTTAERAERALHVEFRIVDGIRTIRSDPLVPAALASQIVAIVGLTKAPFRTLHDAIPIPTVALAGTPPFNAADLRNAYEVFPALSAGLTGAGLDVGITGWGGPSQASFDEYNAYNSLPAKTLLYHPEPGRPGCTSRDIIEWDLDVQMEHAMAPDAAVHAYCADAPYASNLLTIVGMVVSENVLEVISQSWGLCEFVMTQGEANAFEDKFLQGSAQGQAFFTSSGDAGSRECTRSGNGNAISPSWPATAPHTTSVGGTRLSMSGSSWSTERVWNTCAPCSGEWVASGGGFSSLYAKPSWQYAPSGASGRGSPDFGAVGDPATGVRVRSGGNWYQVGGTSASSPIVAGMWLDVVSATGRMGVASEHVWEASTLSKSVNAIRDVTVGHIGDYSAATGYDYASGLGTIKLWSLVQLLANAAPPTNVVATGESGAVLVTWVESPSNEPIQSYRVYRDGVLLGQIPPTTMYRDSGLAPGEGHGYRVSAVTASGEGLTSATVFGRANGPPLGAPRQAFGDPAAPGAGADLQWSAPQLDGGSPITGYRIFSGSSTLPPSADPQLPPRMIGDEIFVLTMDGDLSDATSNGYDAAVADGSPVVTQGKYGQGYRLNWLDEIRIPDPGAIPEGTLAMWARFDGSQERYLAFKRSVSGTTGLALVGDWNGRISATVGPPYVSVYGNAIVPNETWTHVALTWGPSGLKLFVNGALDASTSTPANVGGDTMHVALGRSPTDPWHGLQGTLDEVREYSRALSAREIVDISNAPYAPDASPFTALADTAGSSFTDETVPSGTTRWYQIAALNAFGEGPRAGPIPVSVAPIPDDAPAAVATAGPQDGQIRLSWAAPVAGAAPTGYRIRAGPTADNVAFLADVGDVREFLDSNLGDGTTRYYRVSALHGATEATVPLAVGARTFGTPSEPPTLTQVGPGPGVGELTLVWSPPARDGGSPIMGYQIYRDGAAVASGQSGFVDSGFPDGATHEYRVAAVNRFGEGPQSAPRSGTTFAPPTLPPRYLIALAGPDAGQIRLSWSPSGEAGGSALVGYNIYSEGVLVGQTPATVWFASGLGDGETHSYQVTAANAAGEGPPSVVASATTFQRPGAPGGIVIAPGPGREQISLSWPPAADGGTPVTSYRVYAADDSGDFALVMDGNRLNFTESALGDGHARRYRVAAVNLVGEGEPSAEARSASAVVPSAPSTIAVTTSAIPLSTRVTWGAPLGNASLMAIHSYRVYRAFGSEAFSLLAELQAPAFTLADEMCIVGSTCAYKVSAVGVAGEGPTTQSVVGNGASPRVRLPGAPSARTSDSPRLLGHERLVLQMDRDDDNQPINAYTRDWSPSQAHAKLSEYYATAGKFDRGYRSVAYASYIEVPDHVTNMLDSGSIMMWVNFSQLEPGHGELFMKTSVITQELALKVDAISGHVWFDTSEGISTPLEGKTTIRVGVWTHIAATWGNDGKRIYVNGVLDARDADTTGVFAGTTHSRIGADPRVQTSGVLASFDEVRIYDVPLQVGDIRELMARPYVRLV